MKFLVTLKTNFLQKLKPFDVLIIFFVLGFSILMIYKTSFSVSAKTVEVLAGEDKYEFSLQKNGRYKVKGLIGETEIEVKGGRVRIADSCCPNKTCVNQGFSSTIICLPNKVVVQVKGDEFDAMLQ